MNKVLIILFLFSHSLFFASTRQTPPSIPISDFLTSILSYKKPNDDWATKVNAILSKENTSIDLGLRKGFAWTYYGNDNTDFPPVIICKKNLLELDCERAHILKDIQRTGCFSQKELSLLSEFPDDLSNNLKNYFYSSSDGGFHYDTDYRLKFMYKKNITIRHVVKTIVTCYKQLLPITLINFLYHHTYVEDMENLWEKTQNQYLLELNEKKVLTNKLIDELQVQFIPGSDLLEKKAILDVPFEWTFPEQAKDLYDGNIKFGRIISALIINLPAFYSYYYFTPKYYETRGESERRYDSFFSSLIFKNLFIFFQPYINTAITKVIFSQGITQGLAGIVTLVTLWGIIKAVVTSYISRLKIIDFLRDKFKNKSTKEVISYYLNKSTIRIV